MCALQDCAGRNWLLEEFHHHPYPCRQSIHEVPQYQQLRRRSPSTSHKERRKKMVLSLQSVACRLNLRMDENLFTCGNVCIAICEKSVWPCMTAGPLGASWCFGNAHQIFKGQADYICGSRLLVFRFRLQIPLLVWWDHQFWISNPRLLIRRGNKAAFSANCGI